MISHPYPSHVLQKVAAEIRYSVPTLEPWEARALAQSVLTTLWRESLLTTMEEVEALPDSTLLHTSTGTLMNAGVMAESYRWTHLPARIIYYESDRND